jgi:hypothetical protein
VDDSSHQTVEPFHENMTSIPAPDVAENQKILSSLPFVVVEGVINIRALGGYASSNPDLVVKPLSIFRAGELSNITNHGREQLHALKITKVFDMRSDSEISSYKTESPVIEGVKFIRAPISSKAAYDPASLVTM